MNGRELLVKMAQNAAQRVARAGLDKYAEDDIPVVVPLRTGGGSWTGKPPVSAVASSQQVPASFTASVTRTANGGLMSRHKRQQQQLLQQADALSAEDDSADGDTGNRWPPSHWHC